MHFRERGANPLRLAEPATGRIPLNSYHSVEGAPAGSGALMKAGNFAVSEWKPSCDPVDRLKNELRQSSRAKKTEGRMRAMLRSLARHAEGNPHAGFLTGFALDEKLSAQQFRQPLRDRQTQTGALLLEGLSLELQVRGDLGDLFRRHSPPAVSDG